MDFPDLNDATEQGELIAISADDKFRLVQLLSNTTFDSRQRADIEAQIYECDSMREYEEIEHHLYLNRIQDKDRIAMGFSYNMGDVKKTLRALG